MAHLDTDEGVKNLINKFTSYISISLFVFLPIFTLFLKWLCFRKKFTYMEHLVFVFNTQTVFFLLFIIFYSLNLVVKMENVTWIFVLLFLIYLYKALRYFYGQGHFRTALKFMILNIFYSFLGLAGILIVFLLSFINA